MIGDHMTKKITTITLLVILILLMTTYVISTTYSVIIDVITSDREIINDITIKDLVTNEDGSYNNLYYDAKNKLDINDLEADIVIDSVSLNKALDTLLNNIHNKSKLSNEDIYNIIVDGIYQDNGISKKLRNKLISKLDNYINEISNYLYDIEKKRNINQ